MEDSVVAREEQVRKRWREMNLLSLLEDRRKDGERYFLLDGPPYANYVPHVGHIRMTVIKDLYVRWEFMKGKKVLFQPGFDTHGLPIENMVEKQLGLKSKKDIQKLGIAKFMKTCRESAALNKDLWMEVYDLLGSWYSWKVPYLTYENSYIESTWWSFKRFWEKGLVYEGRRPVFWCPKCETALAGYETTDSYKNVTDPSILVKFPVKGEKDTYLLVYTTTPWTLPANVIIAAAPDKEYVYAKTEEHGTLIIAKNCLKTLEEHEVAYEVVRTVKGRELDQMEYESLLDVPIQKELAKNKLALRVYLSIPILKERVASKVAAKKGIASGDVYEDFVTVEEGTGLVHCAPGHGKTDNEVGKHYGLPELSPVNDQCELTAEAAPFDGKFVKDADHDIADWLHKAGRLFHYGSIEHSYPLCWRCKSPLIFRMSKQWFISIAPLKEKMLKGNESVNWQPGFARERFSHWVANADDWNFSRQRYWGVPIPIWKGESGDSIAVGSVEELKRLATKPVPDDFDLHTVNEVQLKHPETGEVLTRINDIFDVWYDSGSAPYASLHYPFENKELFEENFPIARINESQDQIRGWFYSLMFCGVGAFDKVPYRTVSMPGWVLDDKGEKMSKSVGNMVYAADALSQFGADAIRFYYCWDIAPQNTQKFNLETIRVDVRRVFTIWRNLVKVVEGVVPFDFDAFGKLELKRPEDRWIVSRLHRTIRSVRDAVESFELNLAGRAFAAFVMDDLSRTYVQFVRGRLDEDPLAKRIIAYSLFTVTRLVAPIAPHAAEEVYGSLKGSFTSRMEDSVHLDVLPVPDPNRIDDGLEERMRLAGEVIAAVLAARDKAQLGVRWPIAKVTFDPGEQDLSGLASLEPLILAQVNARSLVVEPFPVSFDAKLDFRALGKVFGERTGDVAGLFKEHKERIIEGITGPEKSVKVDDVEFLPEFVVLEKLVPEGVAVGECRFGSAYISTELGEDLELEGFVREVTRRLQQLRKSSGLVKEDRIEAVVAIGGLAAGLAAFVGEIAARVGASSLRFTEAKGDLFASSQSAVVRGRSLVVSLRKEEGL